MDIINYMATHNTKFNVFKNSLQFLIGASMLIALGQPVDYGRLLLSLLGFLLAYQSVYGMNDILDFSEDSKSKLKRALKPFARGEISLETQVSKMFLYMLFGLSICFFVNTFFGFLVAAMLLLNFFHSYKPLNIKRTLIGLVNIFLIEFIKFSCGWFAIGGSFQNFPYLIPLFMSSAYAMGYYNYKTELSANFFIKKRSIISFFLSLIFYLASVFIYKDFRISLIAIFPIIFLPYLIPKNKDFIEKLKRGFGVVTGIMIIFILLNFLLPYEPFHSINLWLGNLF